MHATSHGVDRQVDTYFFTPRGRLKLRKGKIENSLIFYTRADQRGPKVSHVVRFDLDGDNGGLSDVLSTALGTRTVVSKTREIYFLDNIKIHLDCVDELGSFLEIEAIDSTGHIPEADLEEQCRTLMHGLGVNDKDLIDRSYSDMLSRTEQDIADAA